MIEILLYVVAAWIMFVALLRIAQVGEARVFTPKLAALNVAVNSAAVAVIVLAALELR